MHFSNLLFNRGARRDRRDERQIDDAPEKWVHLLSALCDLCG